MSTCTVLAGVAAHTLMMKIIRNFLQLGRQWRAFLGVGENERRGHTVKERMSGWGGGGLRLWMFGIILGCLYLTAVCVETWLSKV